MMALIQKHAVTPSHPSIRKWRHRAQSSCMKKNTTVLLLLSGNFSFFIFW